MTGLAVVPTLLSWRMRGSSWGSWDQGQDWVGSVSPGRVGVRSQERESRRCRGACTKWHVNPPAFRWPQGYRHWPELPLSMHERSGSARWSLVREIATSREAGWWQVTHLAVDWGRFQRKPSRTTSFTTYCALLAPWSSHRPTSLCPVAGGPGQRAVCPMKPLPVALLCMSQPVHQGTAKLQV